jgi:hypothetical protein
MTHTNNVTTAPIRPSSLALKMLVGAGIALISIIVFLSGAKHPKPEWGSLWMVKPLIMVPLAGAAGGAFSYFMSHLLCQSAAKKVLAIVLGLFGYLVALWLGTVLGLNGTLWN